MGVERGGEGKMFSDRERKEMKKVAVSCSYANQTKGKVENSEMSFLPLAATRRSKQHGVLDINW